MNESVLQPASSLLLILKIPTWHFICSRHCHHPAKKAATNNMVKTITGRDKRLQKCIKSNVHKGCFNNKRPLQKPVLECSGSS